VTSPARPKRSKRKTWPERLGLPNDTPRLKWDYLIVDENGRTVWAKDLALRYRKELIRRQEGDFTLESVADRIALDNYERDPQAVLAQILGDTNDEGSQAPLRG
jgi:hypothetical protein